MRLGEALSRGRLAPHLYDSAGEAARHLGEDAK
jgi:hypothetical protein